MRRDSELRTVAESIREATEEAMKADDSVIVLGLGVNDPGRVFGTTAGLVEKFGPERVFETPTAENGMMGVAVGAALGGYRPIVTQQRADFFFLAMDQLVNSAAKWRFMFGGQFSIPLVVRLVVGRGWGQGPTHSQNLATWLSHISGIKVVYPSNATNAKSLLLESVHDDNPVVYIEDRWLHPQKSLVSADEEVSIGKSALRRVGEDFTIITYGFIVTEALISAELLSRNGVSVDVVDLGSLVPLDLELIYKSLHKTKRALVVEAAPVQNSFGVSLIGTMSSQLGRQAIDTHFEILGMPAIPTPTSFGATKDFYPSADKIASRILGLLGKDSLDPPDQVLPHDVSGESFQGPF